MLFDKENKPLINNSFKNNSPITSSNISNDDLCLEYASHLKMTAPESFELLAFRSKWSEKFRAICFMQLSFLIDVPLDLFHESDDHVNTNLRQSTLKSLLTRRGIFSDGAAISSVLTPELSSHIKQLIFQIEMSGAFSIEGLFRKAGNLKRQRTIFLAVMQENSSLLDFDWHDFSPHELAGALKACISHLTNPILTENLLPLFIQASKLCTKCEHSRDAVNFNISQASTRETENSQKALFAAKQIKSFRLLMQLLPTENRDVLQALLHLLQQVVMKGETTRMTATALGTVFGPVLSPFFIECNETHYNELKCRRQCQEAINLATQLIELNEAIFLIPNSLVQDIHKNMHPSCQPKQMLTSTENAVSLTTAIKIRRRNGSSTSERSWSPCPSSIFIGSHEKKLNKEKKSSPLHTTIRFASSNRFTPLCGSESPSQCFDSLSTDMDCTNTQFTQENQVDEGNFEFMNIQQSVTDKTLLSIGRKYILWT